MVLKSYFFAILVLVLTACGFDDPDPVEEGTSTLQWATFSEFPAAGRRQAVSIGVDNKGYLGYGINSNNKQLNDFYVIDPIKNRWDTLSSNPVTKRELAIFAVGDKIYLISDQQLSAFDLYEYDIPTDTWTQKNNFTKDGDYFVTAAFSLDGKGYYVPTTGGNIWEYDPAVDEWIKKSEFPGESSRETDLMFLKRRAYLFGTSGTLSNKIYQYNVDDDSWEILNNEGGPTVESGYTTISFNDRGYVIMGGIVTTDAMGNPSSNTITKEIWEYIPEKNMWTQKIDFPGQERTSATGFVLNSQGYIGLGHDGQFNFPKDLWTFSVTK